MSVFGITFRYSPEGAAIPDKGLTPSVSCVNHLTVYITAHRGTIMDLGWIPRGHPWIPYMGDELIECHSLWCSCACLGVAMVTKGAVDADSGLLVVYCLCLWG